MENGIPYAGKLWVFLETRLQNKMTAWLLEEKKIKNYSHFDAPLSKFEAEILANDPKAVAKHGFFPFITYDKRWTEFAKKGNSGKIKTRPISYAARSDAYIYMRYRQMLAELYERKLAASAIDDAILAYRKISDPLSGKGKCNIHFASEAFGEIRKQGNCCAIAVDISDYFGSIDHKLLEKQLCDLVGQDKLSEDLLAVYTNITGYSSVKLLKAYERLGYFGDLHNSPPGKTYRGYLKPKHEIPKQLCAIDDFRQKIAGGNGRPSIVQKNSKECGIPQGSPISDLLANIYLFEFDLLVHSEVQKLGGRYTRYSDDILIVAPVDDFKALQIEKWLRDLIPNFGSKLKIKQSKSLILQFQTVDEDQSFEVVYDGKAKDELVRFKYNELAVKKRDLLSSKSLKELAEEYDRGRTDSNGFDYLGFRYDGKGIFLRASTYSNLRRKIKIRCRAAARKFIRERPMLSRVQLASHFKLETKLLQEKFGKVRNFESDFINPQNWTFTTYSRKISEVLEPKLNKVDRQLGNLKKTIYSEAENAFDNAVLKL
jgi:hypothetical protein